MLKRFHGAANEAHAGLELSAWPELQRCYDRMLKRPSIARALSDEMEVYKEKHV